MKNSTPNLSRGGFLPFLLFISIILFSCSKDLESPDSALPPTLEAKLEQNPQYIELKQYWSSAYEKTFNDSLLRNDAGMSLRDQFLTYMEFRYSKLNSFLSDNAEYAEKRTDIHTSFGTSSTTVDKRMGRRYG